MEISFVYMQILVHLHVNKTNFHMKGFAPEIALKQRRKATRKSPISTAFSYMYFTRKGTFPKQWTSFYKHGI